MIFSLHLQLNSLIYSNHFSRYIRGKLVSFPSSKPIARGEILILISTAPGWIQSVLKQLRTFVSARTKVDHVTRSLPLSDVNPRIVSRYRNQGTTCRFQRRPPFPSTMRNLQLTRWNVETIIETLGKYQSRVTEGEIIQTFTHRTGYSNGFEFSSKTRYYR